VQRNLTSDLDFRSGDGGVLVGLIALPSYPNPGPRLYSPAKYRIDLATGRVRNATENEWVGHSPPRQDLFRRSAWSSRQYYFLPLDTVRMDRFVFCDVGQATKTK
jgi:hypothetical protein